MHWRKSAERREAPTHARKNTQAIQSSHATCSPSSATGVQCASRHTVVHNTTTSLRLCGCGLCLCLSNAFKTRTRASTEHPPRCFLVVRSDLVAAAAKKPLWWTFPLLLNHNPDRPPWKPLENQTAEVLFRTLPVQYDVQSCDVNPTFALFFCSPRLRRFRSQPANFLFESAGRSFRLPVDCATEFFVRSEVVANTTGNQQQPSRRRSLRHSS
jgi:hypothetical protein